MHVSSALRITLMFLSVSAPLSQAQQTAPPATGSSAGATATMSTYRNDALHLIYSYPSTYTDASLLVGSAFQVGMSQDAITGKDKAAARCVTVPFSAMNSAHGLALVLLVRADAGCMKKSFTAAQLPALTQDEVSVLSASGAKTQFGNPEAFTLQGHPAELLRGTFTMPTGQLLHAGVACFLLKPDVACLQFLGSSEENVRTMAAFPLGLDGGAPQPVVPPAAPVRP